MIGRTIINWVLESVIERHVCGGGRGVIYMKRPGHPTWCLGNFGGGGEVKFKCWCLFFCYVAGSQFVLMDYISINLFINYINFNPYLIIVCVNIFCNLNHASFLLLRGFTMPPAWRFESMSFRYFYDFIYINTPIHSSNCQSLLSYTF